MQLKNLSTTEMNNRLKTNGLVLAIGPFTFCIQSPIPSISQNVSRLYADHCVLTHDDFIDFYITVKKPTTLRYFYKPQVLFYCDDYCPFLPLPLNQAFPLLEWGMNWCIAQHCHQYLMLHSAVLEKNNKTVILPAESGSGKSTLCALLVLAGWRLLSDEMALIDVKSHNIQPLGRPISLKNASIPLIAQQTTSDQWGDTVLDTSKGTIAHLQPPTKSIERINVLGRSTLIVFPQYKAGAPLQVSRIDKGHAFMSLIKNAFNYLQLGRKGFDSVAGIIDDSACYQLIYSNSDEAIAFFEKEAMKE